MVPDWVVFCDILHSFFISPFPEYVEMILSYSVSYPKNFISIAQEIYLFFIPLTMMFANLLSIVNGVGGCG